VEEVLQRGVRNEVFQGSVSMRFKLIEVAVPGLHPPPQSHSTIKRQVFYN